MCAMDRSHSATFALGYILFVPLLPLGALFEKKDPNVLLSLPLPIFLYLFGIP